MKHLAMPPLPIRLQLLPEITGYVVGADHVEYVIKITDHNDPLITWSVRKRYREIRELHDQLKIRYPDCFPKFPGKRIFGNRDDAFLQRRQSELQAYLTHALTLEPHPDTSALQDFLDLPGVGMKTIVSVLSTRATEWARGTAAGGDADATLAEDVLAEAAARLIDLCPAAERLLDPREALARERTYLQSNVLNPPPSNLYTAPAPIGASEFNSSSLAIPPQQDFSQAQVPSYIWDALKEPVNPEFSTITSDKWKQLIEDEDWHRPSGAEALETLRALAQATEVRSVIEGTEKLRACFSEADENTPPVLEREVTALETPAS